MILYNEVSHSKSVSEIVILAFSELSHEHHQILHSLNNIQQL
jgi:hypothetical protein